MRTWFSFLKPIDRKSAARACQQCSSTSLKRTVATYPVQLTGMLAGRHLDVYRVELDRCRQCGHLMPTPEGKAKIKRCVKVGKKAIIDSILNAVTTDQDGGPPSPMLSAQMSRLAKPRNRVKGGRKPGLANP